MKRTIKCRLVENDKQKEDGKRFNVILLQEGLGNFQTAFYYTKEALRTAVSIFEGSKSFANHPSKSEEEDLPERSIRDQVGHYENISVKEIDGKDNLVGEFVRVDGSDYEWIRDQISHAIEYNKKYPDKEFIGLSINASGDSEEMAIDKMIEIASESCKEKLLEAKKLGIKTINVTNKIEECFSCDIVTRAGAGGAVKTILEGDLKMEKHDDEKKDKELITAMLKKHGIEGQEEALKNVKKQYEDAGMKKEESLEAAAIHLGLSKKSKKEEEDKKKENENNEASKKENEEKEVSKKESMATLLGRVTFLESELKKRDMGSHIEKRFKESGLNKSVLDSFRKGFDDIVDQKSFDKIFDAFVESHKNSSTGFSPEKDSLETKNKPFDFSDCMK